MQAFALERLRPALRLQAALQQRLHVHRTGCLHGAAQVLGLRVGAFLQARRTRRPFAGGDEFLEALRSAVDVEALQQLQRGIGAQLQGTMAVGVVLADQQGQFGAVARCLAALVDRVDQLGPAMFVGDVAWPFGRRRTALAQVMQQAGPAHAQRLFMPGALLQHHQAVHAGVHLGVMGCRLRDAEQGIEFRQQLGQSAAVAQHLDEHIGARLHQRGRFPSSCVPR